MAKKEEKKQTVTEELEIEESEKNASASRKGSSKKAEKKDDTNVKEVVSADGKIIKAVKTAKKSSLGLKKKYNDLEDLKADLHTDHPVFHLVISDVTLYAVFRKHIDDHSDDRDLKSRRHPFPGERKTG